MQIYNNTVMSQWPTAGYSFGGTVGGSMQDIVIDYPFQ
jgi:hypothetical protein